MNSAIRGPGDLQTQLEALLHTVWLCERQWQIDDRFDLILGEPRKVQR